MSKGGRRLKIGLVFDDSLDRPDGVQQYVFGVGAWLAGQGHEVHYLVGETSRTDVPHVHSLARNIGVRFNGNRLTIPLPADTNDIRQLLEDESFDVLHVMMPYSPMMAQKVIRCVPESTVVVGTFHILPQNWLVQWSTSLLGVWLGKSLRRFDKVFAVSSSAARFAESAFKVQDVEVLPNVVNLAHFKGVSPLAKYARDDHTLTIMFLGRLVPRKGCIDLLKAARDIRQMPGASEMSFRVVICGKGPQEADLKQAAEDFGLSDIVEFAGFISEADKPHYLAAADVMVFPSTGGESFGIVLIEAMASGRPVVLAASNPGYVTVMEPQPQQMFKPGDFKGLAQLLYGYMNKPFSRQKAAEWQRTYVEQFDVDVVGERLQTEYEQLVASRHKRLRKQA